MGKHPGVALQKHQELRERVRSSCPISECPAYLRILDLFSRLSYIRVWQYMGDMEGKAISAWKGPLPANLESAAAFDARADRWWTENILRYVARKDESDEPAHILAVSHGGLMHVLVEGLIGSRKVKVGKGVDMGRFRFPNASVSVIEVDTNKKGTLVLFTDTTHLEVELVEENVDIVEEEEVDGEE